MNCEFEEKQYEQHLNNELLHRKHLLYVPGQVMEGKIGFDAALYSRNPAFWRLFDGFPLIPFVHPLWIAGSRPGIQLCRELWDRLGEVLDYFPRFRFNVFVQHKRPEYLTTHTAKEWAEWNRPYYRFQLTTHQQQALEKLESHAGTRAIVVYGSPAFVTLAELWAAIDARRLIERSNFCQPSKLVGHHAYSYVSPGRVGKAHSHAEDVDSFDFYQRFDELAELTEPLEDNRAFLIQTGFQVLSAVEGTGRVAESYNTILGTFGTSSLVENELALAMARISAFNFAVGTSWLVSA